MADGLVTVLTALILLSAVGGFAVIAGRVLLSVARWWMRWRWDWSPQRPDRVLWIAKFWRRVRLRWLYRGGPLPQSRPRRL